MTAAAILLVCLAIAYWWMKPAQKTKGFYTIARRKSRKGSELLTVSICYRGGACSAARSIARKRFLPDQVPRLPLNGCNAGTCDCRYRYNTDRRVWAHRRETGNAHPDVAIAGGGSERRVESGRRRADLAA